MLPGQGPRSARRFACAVQRIVVGPRATYHTLAADFHGGVAAWKAYCRALCAKREARAGNVQCATCKPSALYLHLYLRMLVPYVLWCHLSDSTHTGVLSEGECEYKVPNTYRSMPLIHVQI
jgi:hypothetical protein